MRPKLKFNDSWKRLPIDNVYFYRYYQRVPLSFMEALQGHREILHPDIYDAPNEKLYVRIEMNMEGEKKTRFVENFTRTAAMPHKFEQEVERNILAFSKVPEVVEEARKAGAQLAGGVDLIKEIQNGKVLASDFDTILADPTILAELIVLKGLMKRKFPNTKAGTMHQDLVKNVVKYSTGLTYKANKDEYEKDFGLIETFIGTVSMLLLG